MTIKTFRVLALGSALLLGSVPTVTRATTPTPVLSNYVAPGSFANLRAGETSIGVNTLTNSTFFQLLGNTIRVRWDGAGTATWEDVFDHSTNDPILWADPATGRIFVSHLVAFVGAQNAYSDDDGDTWHTANEPGIVLPSWDHQTIGGGPYPLNAPNPVYPTQLYYCAQPGASASQCARSDDGGLTWGAPFVSNADRCGGLHGHVTVSPDGTVFLPNKSCGSTQGVLTSTTLGAAWTVQHVVGTVPHNADPKVAFDRGGRAYFVASSRLDWDDTTGGRAMVATSSDDGVTWSTPFDAGAAFGVKNTEFPMVVAGDAGRAAVAFYGSTTPGNDQSASFAGAWHLYVAFTYDGGATWKTVDVTPSDPVQRGCIWMSGGGNACRNLVDFQDMTMDTAGRVLIGYADGCVSSVCTGSTGTPNDSRASRGVIARQSGGLGLLSAFDGTF